MIEDEYGKRYAEIIEPPEMVEYPEMKTYAEEAPQPEENKEYAEDFKEVSGEKAKKKRKQSQVSRLLKTLSALVATVVAVVIIGPVIVGDSTTVNFAELAIADTTVNYCIVLENWSGKSYDVMLYNDFTTRTVSVKPEKSTEETTDDEATTTDTEVTDATETTLHVYLDEETNEVSIYNEEANLKSGMTYTLAVKSGTKTLAKKTFRTLREDELPVTSFDASRDLYYGCACKSDGTFHFKFEAFDKNGWWSNFNASLTDSEGNVSECLDFTADGSLQTIQVTGELSGTTATFKLTCTSYQNDENGEEITLFESEVEI